MEVAISIADSIENAGVKATPLETKGFIFILFIFGNILGKNTFYQA